MKHLPAILITFLIGSRLINAQDSGKLEELREKILPKYSMYFDQAKMTENGQLSLSALDKYVILSVDGKKPIMANICTAWQDSLVIVSYGSKRELWGWKAVNGNTQLLDEWDLNASQLVKMPEIMPRSHPWFLYVGGQLGGDVDGNINLSLNTRLGFFLLLNRWDMAATFSTGLSGNVETSGSLWSNLGLMSRVHFPIKRIGLSPNIGGEITMSPYGGSSSISGALVLGLSWYVGFGSLDIGVSIGDQVSTMGGFTFSPGIKNNNKKRK